VFELVTKVLFEHLQLHNLELRLHHPLLLNLRFVLKQKLKLEIFGLVEVRESPVVLEEEFNDAEDVEENHVLEPAFQLDKIAA
jgi:hypothetical protein